VLNRTMKRILCGNFLWVVVIGFAGLSGMGYGQQGTSSLVPDAAQKLMQLANQERAQTGAGPLQWDEGLAAAARDHCLRMAAEGPISHRYGGEDDLSTRAGNAGALFNFIEENVAIGSTPGIIHEAWMHSPGHRSNLLNPQVDRVGIAVVAARGVLYATADYARGVNALTQTQVETKVAGLLRASGVEILTDHAQAREACAADHGLPAVQGSLRPGFIMRWQDSGMDQLPAQLAEKLATRQYHRAAVGNCPAQGMEGAFTAYRAAVLLY
jgi:cysteine-rich secretory family protein